MNDLTEAVVKLNDIARYVARNVDAEMAKQLHGIADKLNKHTEETDEGIVDREV